ncbi:hypothetical protein SEEM954_18617, partial [Salmonella enterica subsp. enterica serovar Montevideo str. 531954]
SGSGYRPRQKPVSRSSRPEANLPNRSIRAKPQWKRPSPAPKASKQEQQAGSEPVEPADPRKAAVAAAIARVQAKKAAQQQVVNED